MQLQPNNMRTISHALILLTFISCNRAEKPKEFDKESTVGAVTRMLDNYHRDIAESGLIAEFKYLDTSSDFYWVPPGYTNALTYDSVKSILEENSKAFSSIEFHWDTLQIFPLTNEIANYSGIVGGWMMDTSGTKSEVSIIESGTLIKRTDGWKLLSGQSRLLDTEPNDKAF